MIWKTKRATVCAAMMLALTATVGPGPVRANEIVEIDLENMLQCAGSLVKVGTYEQIFLVGVNPFPTVQRYGVFLPDGSPYANGAGKTVFPYIMTGTTDEPLEYCGGQSFCSDPSEAEALIEWGQKVVEVVLTGSPDIPPPPLCE